MGTLLHTLIRIIFQVGCWVYNCSVQICRCTYAISIHQIKIGTVYISVDRNITNMCNYLSALVSNPPVGKWTRPLGVESINNGCLCGLMTDCLLALDLWTRFPNYYYSCEDIILSSTLLSSHGCQLLNGRYNEGPWVVLEILYMVLSITPLCGLLPPN